MLITANYLQGYISLLRLSEITRTQNVMTSMSCLTISWDTHTTHYIIDYNYTLKLGARSSQFSPSGWECLPTCFTSNCQKHQVFCLNQA